MGAGSLGEMNGTAAGLLSRILQQRCSWADPAGFIIDGANRVQMLSAQFPLDKSLSRTGLLPIISFTSLSSSALIYLLQNHCYFNGLLRVEILPVPS